MTENYSPMQKNLYKHKSDIFKTIIISYSTRIGGAGIAADNFRQLLNDDITNYQVGVISQDKSGINHIFKRLVSFILSKLQFDGNPTKHSLNLFSFKPVINSFMKDKDTIHHIHWINNDTLSIFDFDKVPSGSVITLHDEWLYCGSEHHYKLFDESNDFKSSYSFFKHGVFGIHWNYIIWSIKNRKLFQRKDLIYTVPSQWMMDRAKSSAMLKNSEIYLLPNPIDTNLFKRSSERDIGLFKSKLNLDVDYFIITFNKFIGNKNKLKGIEILEETFRLLESKNLTIPQSKIVLIDFGGKKGDREYNGFRNISLGEIDNHEYLAKLYSSSDCVIVPSMVESFGQVAAEALSCSTPVVSFNTSGLKDIVIHNHTGMVAESFSAKSLCDQIVELINTPPNDRSKMGNNGREHVINNFSYKVIQKKYINILDKAKHFKK